MNIGNNTNGTGDGSICPHLYDVAIHYRHAKEKHPQFADRITNWDADMAAYALRNSRVILEGEKRNAQRILDCEIMEALDAYTRGDHRAAIEECYDAVAVLLRMADMIAEQAKSGIAK